MGVQQDLKALHTRIASIRLRLVLLQALHALTVLLPIGLLLFALLYALQALIGLPAQNVYIVAGIAAAIGLLYFLLAALRGIRSIELARRIDRESQNSDRTLSALSFGRSSELSPLMELAIADAGKKAATLRLDWQKVVRGRLLISKLVLVIVCAALAYTAAMVDWQSYRALPAEDDRAMIPMPETEMPDITEAAELPEQVMPEEFMIPAIGIIQNWKAELSRRRERQEIQEPQPGEERETPETHYGSTPGVVSDQARSVPLVHNPNAAITASDLSRLVDPTMDGQYAAAFAEMDKWVFDEEALSSEDLKEVAEALDGAGQTYVGSGEGAMESIGVGFKPDANGEMEGDGKVELQNALKASMQESFGEFLQDYAGHLSRIADNAEMVPADENASGEMMMTNMPPPEDAELSMVPMDESGEMQIAGGLGDKPEMPTSSEAGTGSGTPTGTIAPDRVEADGTDVLDLESKVGEGRSPVQIIEDFSGAQRDSVDEAYARLFERYAEQAGAELQVEQLPVSLKVYVRDYFMAIKPPKQQP